MPNQFPTVLTPTQFFKFYDPNNTGNSWTVNVNPTVVKRKAGTVRKYIKTVNGTGLISGGREYPPAEIVLTWNQIDKTQVEGIRQFAALDAVVMVDNNDQGFLGVLVIDEADQLGGKSGNVWYVSASFLTVSPYNGTNSVINKLSPPLLAATVNTSGGYIPNTSLFVWPTVVTKWGESTPGTVLAPTTAGSNQWVNVTFAPPASAYYRSTRLYWNSTNNSTTATFLAEIPAGLTAAFPIYGPYNAYTNTNPPLLGTNFTGYFSGGLWVNDV